jgi:hypothetical protein
MSVKRLCLSQIFLLATICLGVVPAGRSEAAPLIQGTNLLNSPGFEAPAGSSGTDPSWARWHEEQCNRDAPNYDFVCRPDWSIESNPVLVHTGGQSQHVGVYYTPWHGGVMQTITVPAGSRIRLTAWGRVRASQEQYPAPSDPSVDARLQVGIDPNGGGIWYQNVTWSGTINPHDTWQPVSVEVTAGASGQVSVFLSANFRGYSRTHLDVWFDDASLEVLVPPTPTRAPLPTSPPVTNTPLPTPTPEATPTPTETPTSTPTPEPTATPTPGVGSVCVAAYDDGNSNGMQDGVEGTVSGVTITLFDGQQIVGTQVSNALAGQVCFDDLHPGAYQVFQTVPASRQATTADNVPIALEAGQAVKVLFGSIAAASVIEPTSAAVPTTAPQPTAVPTQQEPADAGEEGIGDTLLAVSGIIVLLVAAALIGVYFVFRGR